MSKKLNMATISLSLFFMLLMISTGDAQEGGIFDVTKFGAKPDSDITEAVSKAWTDACASTTPSKVLVPKGNYQLAQVNLLGPCKAPIEFELQGTVKALTTDPKSMKVEASWVTFQQIENFKLFGGGVFDGQGAAAWGTCGKSSYCNKLPMNLRFNFITNGLVEGVTTLDSKQFHVNVLGCKNITFLHFTVTAPETSTNTDGIHIGRSDGVNVTSCNIKTGDDCVSIGDGSKKVFVTDVTCGPGHGISVGSLGKFPKEEPVDGITVKNCTISNTQNGVRVKTWPASFEGTVSNMNFEDITMVNVSSPINIDQTYCPWNQCNAKVPSRVKISNVILKNIKGTSATAVAVNIACSSGVPCEGVEMDNIDLQYTGKDGPAKSTCSNVKPKISGTQNPPACTAPAAVAA